MTMPLEQLPEKDNIFRKTKQSQILENNSNKTSDDITEHVTCKTCTTVCGLHQNFKYFNVISKEI